MTNGLSHEQVTQLLRPINERRVSHKDGQSHVEAYDVRAHLNRIFGFGEWSEDVIDLVMLYEQSKPHERPTEPPRWRAAYRATVRLTIHATTATYTETAVGTNFGWLPDSKRDETHDMAIKTAASQALKRCAINLGDQYGLSLYQKGSTAALVGRTLVMPAQPDGGPHPDSPPRDVDAHVPAVTPETPAPQPDTDAPAAPEAHTPADTAAGQGTDWAAIIAKRVRDEAPKKAAGQQRRTFLLRQLSEAGSKGVTASLVVNEADEYVPLGTLIHDALRAA